MMPKSRHGFSDDIMRYHIGIDREALYPGARCERWFASRTSNEDLPLAFACTIPAIPTLQVDDERVRITRWDFEPGAHTGWHEHAMPYCVVMVLGGTLAVHDGAKETRVTLAAGDSYVRPKGITHDVMNGSDHPVAFVEIEMKG